MLRTRRKTAKPNKILPLRTLPLNCLVLNTDAAWKASSNIAGFGWTLRDCACTSSFTGHERFVGSALAAESLALHKALKRCKEAGVQRLICESDSAQLITVVNTSVMKPEIYDIVSDILELVSFFDVICFSWIPRERNLNADRLAKLCLLEVEAFMVLN